MEDFEKEERGAHVDKSGSSAPQPLKKNPEGGVGMAERKEGRAMGRGRSRRAPAQRSRSRPPTREERAAAERAVLLSFVIHVFCGKSSIPLLRVLLFLVVVGGVLAGVGLLLGPLALGITSATGLAAAGVRQWGKRRAN